MTSNGHEAVWLTAGASLWFVAAWVAVVLIYGLYRSTGEARQDPQRPSGPFA